MQELLLYIGITCILLFFITLSMIFTLKPSKESDLQALVDGRAGTISHQNSLRKRIENNSVYVRYKKYLNNLIQLTYDQERTPESVVQYQTILIVATLAGVFIVDFIFSSFIITAIVGLVMLYMVYLPIASLRGNLKKKYDEFDENLPSFLNNMLLAMLAGSGIEKSMVMSIETLDGNIKDDFLKLLNDTRTYTDDVAKPYMNLAKRIKTKDCERFANVVISGLKNGNKMSDILRSESAHLNKEQINKIQDRQNKNKLKATAISTGFIFMPVLVILIAPMMATSM